MAFTWVVCIDGTWNQPGQTDEDPVTEEEPASPSNVAKTCQALADTHSPAISIMEQSHL